MTPGVGRAEVLSGVFFVVCVLAYMRVVEGTVRHAPRGGRATWWPSSAALTHPLTLLSSLAPPAVPSPGIHFFTFWCFRAVCWFCPPHRSCPLLSALRGSAVCLAPLTSCRSPHGRAAARELPHSAAQRVTQEAVAGGARLPLAHHGVDGPLARLPRPGSLLKGDRRHGRRRVCRV